MEKDSMFNQIAGSMFGSKSKSKSGKEIASKTTDLRLLVLGLDNAGKTTILK